MIEKYDSQQHNMAATEVELDRYHIDEWKTGMRIRLAVEIGENLNRVEYLIYMRWTSGEEEECYGSTSDKAEAWADYQRLIDYHTRRLNEEAQQ